MANPLDTLNKLVTRQVEVIEAQKKLSAEAEAERERTSQDEKAQPNQTGEQPPNVPA